MRRGQWRKPCQARRLYLRMRLVGLNSTDTHYLVSRAMWDEASHALACTADCPCAKCQTRAKERKRKRAEVSRLALKPCECGCGALFAPARADAKYAPGCRAKVAKAQRAAWKQRQVEAEKRAA
jgi:hypothetical protein